MVFVACSNDETIAPDEPPLTEGTFDVGGIHYDINSDAVSVSITQSNNSYSGLVVIPSTVTYGKGKYIVTRIRNRAFCNSTNLISVTIPETVTRIDYRAFENCTNLQNIYCWAEKVPYTDEGEIFYGCNIETATLHVPESAYSAYKNSIDWSNFGTITTFSRDFTSGGIYYKINSDASVAVTYGTSNYNSYSGSIVIPSTVMYGGKKYSVTSIGDHAFDDCAGLTSVTIPNTVTSIGTYAFSNCSGLTSITIPNNVTSIGYYAFDDCDGLTKAEFASIESLCKIKFEGSKANPLRYAKHLYIKGFEIKDLVIPEAVTQIGSYGFYGFTNLRSVSIPNSVTSIGDHAFYNCECLTTVTIGKNVTSIKNRAFYGCSSLYDVYCLAEQVPETDTDKDEYVFGRDGEVKNAILHVPASSLSLYKSTYPWREFGKILPLD
jgi:hypothetical protein